MVVEKYEKVESELSEGLESDKYVDCDKSVATHVHYCYHDEKNPRPCRRVPL